MIHSIKSMLMFIWDKLRVGTIQKVISICQEFRMSELVVQMSRTM